MGISALLLLLLLLSEDSLHHEKLVLDTSSPRRQSLKVAPSSVSSTHLLSSVESQCFHKEQKLTNKKTRLLTTQWCFHENQTPQKSHFTYSTNPQKPVRIKKNLHHVVRLHKKKQIRPGENVANVEKLQNRQEENRRGADSRLETVCIYAAVAK